MKYLLSPKKSKALLWAKREHNREYDEKRLDIIAGAFGGAVAMLCLWVFVAVL